MISTADQLLMILPRSGGLTYPQLAHRMYGTPEHPLGDAQIDRKRRSAIRACQQAVAVLRDRGEPVCGGDDGMWLASTSAEAFEEYRRLRARALGQIQRASRLKARAFAMQRAEQGAQQTQLWEAA